MNNFNLNQKRQQMYTKNKQKNINFLMIITYKKSYINFDTAFSYS